LSWKDIAAKFSADMGKRYSEAALQMRYKRCKERTRVWTEYDVFALQKAHEDWVNKKFDIIAAKVTLIPFKNIPLLTFPKMPKYGATQKWTSQECSHKWETIRGTQGNDIPPQSLAFNS